MFFERNDITMIYTCTYLSPLGNKLLYMVIEKYKDKEAVYKRLHEKGRMLPNLNLFLLLAVMK